MKQIIILNDSSIQSSTLSQTQLISKKQRINKNRLMRKKQVALTIQQKLLLDREERKKLLTKQQKQELQKIKNREAAQKSRDQKKEYMERVQAEKGYLKKQIQCLTSEIVNIKQRMCRDCQYRMNLQEPAEDVNEEISNMINTDLNYNTCNSSEQSHFMRLVQQDTPVMPIIFMVSLVLISVFVYTPPQLGNAIELYNVEEITKLQFAKETKQKQKLIQIDSKSVIEAQQKFELVPIKFQTSQNSIQVFQSQQHALANYLSPSSQHCLKNYMTNHEKIQIRQNLRSKNKKNTNNNRSDILFCDTPRLLQQSQHDNIFTTALEIILNGNQLRQVVMKESAFILNKFSYSGLYALKVEIKQIRKYNQMECLT